MIINGTEEIKKDEKTQKVQKLKVRILEGEYNNEEYEMEYVLSENMNESNIKTELQEDDNILVNIIEDEGEIVSVNFKELIYYNYMIYIVGAILLIVVLLISKKMKSIRPILALGIIILSIYFIFLINVPKNINIIMLSGITSAVIILLTSIIINGFNKKMIFVILFALIGVTMTTGTIYALTCFIGLSGNIWCDGLIKAYININNLVISIEILISSIAFTIISCIVLTLLGDTNKLFYKTKSDNIIDGQRSLKL